jgi:hypothetical protein
MSKMEECKIHVSVGELFDKYSILEIKLIKIKDVHKLKLVFKELKLLEPRIQKYKLDSEIYDKLKIINTKLWNIEDKIRIKESLQEFDNEFIQLARDVYFSNDVRSSIKKNINMIFKSEIIEVKEYVNYKN